MAEERTLGLARTQAQTAEEPSKEELQRRMDEARDSISHTVTEIKETVANQVQAVKDTLDWREQYKRRPIAWSVGAAGVGFAVGYGLAAVIKGDADDDVLDYTAPESRNYSQSLMSSQRVEAAPRKQANGHDQGPGFLKKLSHTPAFGRVKEEAGNIGDAFIQEITKTAKVMVLPAIMNSIRNFIGGHLPQSSEMDASRRASMSNEASRSKPDNVSSYQPTLDRGHS